MPGFEVFGDEERKEVNDVLESGVLMRYGFEGMRNGHWKAKEFEEAFAERMESSHCQLVSSGTSALTVALAAAGVGAGDEVIMPVFTFVATFESILATGAVPVLVDIDDTLTLSPSAVKKAIGPKTRCIMPVHMCGSMAQLKELKGLCDAHNLILIEDACQVIGGSYEGTPLGSYGHLGCFSFDFVKTITCGEGGAVITNNKTYFNHAHQYQDHGHDHIGNDRGAESHPHLGYNYRISELQAAVGIAQLRKLDHILGIQKKHYDIICNELEKVDGITFRRVPEGGVQNYSFVNFFLPDGESAKSAHKVLSENGVDGCFYWFSNNWHYIRGWEHLQQLKSLHLLPAEITSQFHKRNRQDYPESNSIMSRTISSLVKIGWSEDEVKDRARKMRMSLQNVLGK